jgi:hypothetical protein
MGHLQVANGGLLLRRPGQIFGRSEQQDLSGSLPGALKGWNRTLRSRDSRRYQQCGDRAIQALIFACSSR